MGSRSFTWFLLAVLIAFAWGAWDWVIWAWNELTANEQIKWVIGLSLIFGGIFFHLLKPLIWHNFS